MTLELIGEQGDAVSKLEQLEDSGAYVDQSEHNDFGEKMNIYNANDCANNFGFEF